MGSAQSAPPAAGGPPEAGPAAGWLDRIMFGEAAVEALATQHQTQQAQETLERRVDLVESGSLGAQSRGAGAEQNPMTEQNPLHS